MHSLEIVNACDMLLPFPNLLTTNRPPIYQGLLDFPLNRGNLGFKPLDCNHNRRINLISVAPAPAVSSDVELEGVIR